jgi:hypothetical protein
MPTELKGANELRKALKKFSPDLDKETREEMVGFLKPLVKKARGFLPSNADAPSGFVKHEVKTAKFPMYDAAEARRGVGYKLTPTKPNRQGWVQTVSIHNKTAAGAIVETAGRKSGNSGRFSPRFSGSFAGSGKMQGRAMFKAYSEDQGKAKAGVIKALEKAADKFNARGNNG